MYQGQPGVAVATRYTAPAYAVGSPYAAGATALVRRIIVANPTAAAVTYTLYLVPSGGTAGAANVIFPATSIAAGQVQIFDLEQDLYPGDFMADLASVAASLTVTASGVTFQ
jgi:hypothetical protein